MSKRKPARRLSKRADKLIQGVIDAAGMYVVLLDNGSRVRYEKARDALERYVARLEAAGSGR